MPVQGNSTGKVQPVGEHQGFGQGIDAQCLQARQQRFTPGDRITTVMPEATLLICHRKIQITTKSFDPNDTR